MTHSLTATSLLDHAVDSAWPTQLHNDNYTAVGARPIRSAGVMGSSETAISIATALLDAGIPVTLLERSADALDRALADIAQCGQIPRAQSDARLALLTPTRWFVAMSSADILFEAMADELPRVAAALGELARVARPRAIIVSTHRALDAQQLAQVTARPRDSVRMSLVGSARSQNIIEISNSASIAPEALKTVCELAQKLNKTAVLCGSHSDSIGARMVAEYARQAYFLLDAGASFEQIDCAMEACGFEMGPFRLHDALGNDNVRAICKLRLLDRPTGRWDRIADRLFATGRFGQKCGAGWYDYSGEGCMPVPSSQVRELVERHRTDLGLRTRPLHAHEIANRLVGALVEEGARLLEERVAESTADIDLVCTRGYGFLPLMTRSASG